MPSASNVYAMVNNKIKEPDDGDKVDYYMETIRMTDSAALKFLCKSLDINAEELKRALLTDNLVDRADKNYEQGGRREVVLEHGMGWVIDNGRIISCKDVSIFKKRD